MQPSRQSIGKAGWRSLASSWARCTVKIAGLGKGQMDYAPILDWLAQYAPETPLIRDEVILECAPADIKILHQMQQSIEEKRMK